MIIYQLCPRLAWPAPPSPTTAQLSILKFVGYKATQAKPKAGKKNKAQTIN
jgi:hypothetical protein